jgi:GTP cyclohydrolase I
MENSACLELLEEPVAASQEKELQNLVHRQLLLLGEDPRRDGLRQTPSRAAKSLAFLTSGYGEDPKRTVNGAIFDDDSEQMVIVRSIEFYSLC